MINIQQNILRKLTSFRKIAPNICGFQLTKQIYQFSKKDLKVQQRREEAAIAETISNLDSVAEQNEYSKEQLDQLISERKQNLKTISQDDQAPVSALLTGLILTTPVMAGIPLLMQFPSLADQSLIIGYLKYVGIHISCLSGMHWGFAISEHECQTDAIDSSSSVRLHFFLSSIPIFTSYFTISNLVYASQMALLPKTYAIYILISLYAFLSGLDYYALKKQICPKWFFKLKLGITSMSLVGLGSLLYYYLENENNTVFNAADNYRKYIPSKDQVLNIKIEPRI